MSISEHISKSEPLSSSAPARQPANDMMAFDVSRQSPEQIARLFARWKEQRKQASASQGGGRLPHLKPVPPTARRAAREAEEATPTAIAGPESGGPVRYSASFEELLAKREPTLAQRVWNPAAGLAKLGRPHPPLRRSRMKWALAGAASVVAVAAVAGGALWEQSVGRQSGMRAGAKPAADTAPIAGPAEAAPPAAPSHPMDIPMAEPFVAIAAAAGEVDWPMRQAVDMVLMKAAPVAEAAQLPLMPRLKPPVPAVQTASKASASKASAAPAAVPAAQPAAGPDDAAIARVALPLIAHVTTATVSMPVAPAADARAEDASPDGNASRGNDKSPYTFGANNRVASSSGKSAGATGSGGSADPGSGGSGGAGTGDSGDPSGGGTGGAGSGSGGNPGGGTGGAIGGALGGLGDALGGGKGNASGDKDKDKDKGKDKGKDKDKDKAD